MLFVKSDDLKTGMRLAKPIYNKNGVMLYERNSKLTSQGIMSIHNFGLIGVYILEPAEPLPPMSEDDIEFERFQTMSIFTIKEVLDQIADKSEAKELYPFANQVIKRYGNLHHKINFVQNLRSAEDTPYKHALNTAILCALMSKKMKLEFKEQLDVVVAGILYDIGSLLVPVSLRKLGKNELTEEDKTKINTYHYAGYQMLSQDYNLDPSVKRNATLVCKELFDIKTDDEVVVTKRIPEVEILKVAAVYDNMTAMKYEEAPLSEITALRHLLAKENGFDQPAVRALVDSINILQPGVAVELSNGDRGLVITEGPIDILRPFVLSFKDNQVLNLSDESVASDIEIKDIMRTMDNRHVVAKDMLQSYVGEEVHIGENSSKKHF
ncbi:MAG TPA: phosphohydrolase [Lactococcus sp.]|nr:phosphohydrolase [Lactococcus sp.]